MARAAARQRSADIGDGDQPSCRFRVSRKAQAGNFGKRERALCQLMLPHITSAVKLRSLIDVAEAERSLYAGTLERLAVGAVILDKKGKILRTNHAAEAILAERDGVSAVNGFLQAVSSTENRELHGDESQRSCKHIEFDVSSKILHFSLLKQTYLMINLAFLPAT